MQDIDGHIAGPAVPRLYTAESCVKGQRHLCEQLYADGTNSMLDDSGWTATGKSSPGPRLE
jgi:hypothetical protein